MKLSIGFEQCACDYGCDTCGQTGTMPYWKPPRWVQIMAAIVARTDICGGWMPGSAYGTYADIGGVTRRVIVDDYGEGRRSLMGLVRSGRATRGNANLYYPTAKGRSDLEAAMRKFVAAANRRGPAPRTLSSDQEAAP